MLYGIICIFLFSRTCDVSCTCQVSEIPNPISPQLNASLGITGYLCVMKLYYR